MFSTPFILQACPFVLVLVRRKKKAWGWQKHQTKIMRTAENLANIFIRRVGRSAALIPPVVRLFTGP